MHPSPLFMTKDEALIREMISASPFAMLAVNAEGGPLVAMLPMMLSADGAKLSGHVSVRNEVVAHLGDAPVPATVIIPVNDAYVSPSFYPSKAVHGRVVPTWSYEAVELRGEVQLIRDAGALRNIVETLTDHMEEARATRWQVSDAPEDYIEQQLRGICGLQMTIKTIRGVRKLSQNKSAEDLSGVIAGLSRETRPAAQAMARDIEKLREAE